MLGHDDPEPLAVNSGIGLGESVAAVFEPSSASSAVVETSSNRPPMLAASPSAQQASHLASLPSSPHQMVAFRAKVCKPLEPALRPVEAAYDGRRAAASQRTSGGTRA
jgi:hypothetical protein